MCARRYTRTQHLLPVIEEMIVAGKTYKEIEREIGLEGDRPVHNLLKRERKKEIKGIRKPRGIKLAKTLLEYNYENKRLKMEVEELRDFLLLTERK